MAQRGNRLAVNRAPAPTAARSRWARLIARIYEVSPLACPDCGGEMRILAVLTDPGPQTPGK